MIHLLRWLPGRVRSCWDRRSCITEGLSYTNLLLAVCVREERRERQVCVCVRGGESHKQTNKQKYIQEGIFFPAEVPVPSCFGRKFERLYSPQCAAAAAGNNSLGHFCPLSLCFSKLRLFSCLLLISSRAGTGKMHAGQCLLLSLPGTAELEQ